jgi:hypothetical protein
VRVNNGFVTEGVVPEYILNLRTKDLRSGVVAVVTLMLLSTRENIAAGIPENVGSEEWR